MGAFHIQAIPLDQLRYDLRNPAVATCGFTDDAEITSHLIDRISPRQSIYSYANQQHSQLHPWVVVPEDDHYAVLDGNIRLAASLAVRVPEINRQISHKHDVTLSEDDSPITVAVFTDRKSAYPYFLRHVTAKATVSRSLRHWAYLFEHLIELGFKPAQIADFTGFRASSVASTLEAQHAFEQMKALHPDRWTSAHSSSSLSKCLHHHSIRATIGLSNQPDPQYPTAPLPQTGDYPQRQLELMDLIYLRPHDDQESSIRHSLEITESAQLHQLYDDPDILEAFRQHGYHHHTVASFLDAYHQRPTVRQARDTVSLLAYHANQEMHAAKRAANITPAENSTVHLANVVYCLDQHGESHYVVELASRYPDRHRPVVEYLQQKISQIEPTAVVRFW